MANAKNVLSSDIAKKYGKNKNDTGSTEVQIVFLTNQIQNLTNHLVKNKKDFISKRGLHMKVSKRKSLLAYLKNKDIERYRNIISELKLRGI